MSPDLAAAAFQYTLQGLAVFPLTPGSKIPLGGSHGYLDASVDPDIAVGRWRENPVIRDRLVAAPNWLIQMALPSPPPVRTEPVELPRDTERYVKVAVDSELARLVKGIENRNHTLNDVAFHLGEFIGGGYIPHDWAEQELTQRAITIGLPPSEAAKTIKSGLDAGAAQPRKLSNA